MQLSINPANGTKLAELSQHCDADVDHALSAASAAQKKWRRLAVDDRCHLLTAIAHVLRAKKLELAKLISLEIGKPITESLGEIEKCAVTCDFYANSAPRFLADETIESNASHSGVVFDPLGVVLAIMPWNYPFWQFFRFAAPALAAGNGVILKHAANVPQCAVAIEDVMVEAGCPEGLMRSLLIPASKVAGLIADDRIAAITLTGSMQVGQIVAGQAGQALKKQVLELGGSDPFIVLADADIEAAAQVAVKARYINVGQSCVNAKRFIVEDSVVDTFTEAFVAGVKALKVGDPMDPDTQIGPMARENLRDELHDQVQRSVSDGATCVLGGTPLDLDGSWYAPTVLTDVTPGHTSFNEELFGPVASIICSRLKEQAVALANDTEFGLGASLWTQDMDLAKRLTREIDAGVVFVNGMVASDARLPFGGIKKSGYGRELGSYGIREFTNMKTIWIGPAK